MSSAVTEITQFVNRKLGLDLRPVVEIESRPTSEYVSVRVPGKEKIIAHPVFFPSDEAGQKTVLLHEISEIGYEKKGLTQPHDHASQLTQQHWKDVGGKSPEAIHKELISKGYYTRNPRMEVRKGLMGRINGLAIWLVDGSKVRKYYYKDFTEGGHGLVYRWIPRHEVWIDDAAPPKDRNHVIMHELYERELMRKGWSYARAHVRANAMERALR